MAYTTIDDPSAYFKVQLYTGTGSSHAVTFNDTDTDMQPDLVWIKNRSSTRAPVLFDSVRGVEKRLVVCTNDASSTDSNMLTAFGSDGFTVGSSNECNESTDLMVAWNWKANATSSTNSVGSVDVDLAVNTTAGISIGTYTGDGADGATFGHGLGVIPHVVLVKVTGNAGSWYMRHNSQTSDKNLILDTDVAEIDSGSHNAGIIDDLASTTTWTMTKNGATDPSNNNGSGKTYVVYTFAEKKGYSKFGIYTGTGSASGPYIFTGLRPAFVLIKRIDSTGSWLQYDNKREGYNTDNDYLIPDTDADESGGGIDIVSNGFKIKTTNVTWNAASGDYVYLAFAESPFVNSNGVPTNAR